MRAGGWRRVCLLAQGALTIQRLDPLVALAMIATLRGAVRRSPVEMGLWAGLGGRLQGPAAARRAGDAGCGLVVLANAPRAALAAGSAAGLAIGFGPMLLASPGAVGDFFRYHGLRGLQVESTFGALVGAARIVLGTAQPATISYGSFNVDGALPDALARLSLPLTIAGIAALCVREWRAGAAADERGAHRATRVRDPRGDARALADRQGLLPSVPDVGNPAGARDPGTARGRGDLARDRRLRRHAALLPRLLRLRLRPASGGRAHRARPAGAPRAAARVRRGSRATSLLAWRAASG